MSFCENCGAPISDDATYCEGCGEKTGNPGPAEPSPSPSVPARPVQKAKDTPVPQVKNPFIALILSLLITGIGQIYNGQLKKGLLLLVGVIILWVVFWPIAIIVWLFGMYDAYTTALKINKGEAVPDIFSK